ncbi:hypothetical protein HYH03_007330 [Edaphochlamys debaryana]|uniref:AAA+ ATPase domain-containing protein n=1 Tax=Edaphochlamys debaryana TaxID=47281 RepID=A0A835Y3J3_9CHLO|nr:hypothetical protein HYH03_007330 [Edaphochlamys debaryana]|eukprot:KAG2494564.1 hypothetical protein HYH03_007330 [Edaphochlamys debaryana]
MAGAAFAPALQDVLCHAVAALESEDRGDPITSLTLYNSAWCALSCALELHAAGGLPPLVRDTCTALLETFRSRYEAIRIRLRGEGRTRPHGQPSSCGGEAAAAADAAVARRRDVGRGVGGTPGSTCSSGHPCAPTRRGSAAAAGAGAGAPEGTLAYGFRPVDATPPYDNYGGGFGAPAMGPEVDEDDPDGLDGAGADPDQSNAARGDGGDGNLGAAGPGPAGHAADFDRGSHLRSRSPHRLLGPPGTGAREPAVPPGPSAAAAAAGPGAPSAGLPEGLVLTEHMKEVMAQCLRVVPPGGSLEELAGLGSVKEELRLGLLLPMRLPHIFLGIRQAPRNFLLHGPPGTGKTMLVERIASEAGARLLLVTPGAVLSKWSGESEKQLRAVFALARALQPCIVFMDEVDSLAPARGSGEDPLSRRLLNELLVQMSALATEVAAPAPAPLPPPKPRHGTGAQPGRGGPAAGGGAGAASRVYLMAATNRIQDCDPALLRRFDRRMAVPLPDTPARAAFIAAALARPELAGAELGAEEVQALAERTQGFSGSDLAQLCREAAMGPVRELLPAVSAAAAAAAAGGYRNGAATAAVDGGGYDGGYGGEGAEDDEGEGGPGMGAEAAGLELELGDMVLRPLELRDFEAALGAIRPAAADARGSVTEALVEAAGG